MAQHEARKEMARKSVSKYFVMYHEYYELSRLYPEIEKIHIKATDTNAWSWNRLKEFSLGPDSKCNFHLDCPMSKCLGYDNGIDYKNAISDMVQGKETHRQVRLNCSGYGGYNLTFHCDWYAVLDISITYRKP